MKIALLLLMLAAGAVTSAARPGSVPASSAAVQLVVAPAGNEVRYLVREQLVGFDFPNHAVGKSPAVSGGLSIDSAGRPLPAESKFVVDAASFVSDRDRRDNYLRTRVFTVEQHPTITLVPTELRGITLPLPTSGTRTLQLIADLTVRGVTRPTSWHVSARFDDGHMSGTAFTAFTFADFELEKPRVRSVLTVADTIRLEYDFNLLSRPVPSS